MANDAENSRDPLNSMVTKWRHLFSLEFAAPAQYNDNPAVATTWNV